MAAAIAPNVIILKVWPVAYNTIKVSNSVTGIVIKMTRLAFKERRKIIATKMARANPIHKLSVTLLTDSFTKSDCT